MLCRVGCLRWASHVGRRTHRLGHLTTPRPRPRATAGRAVCRGASRASSRAVNHVTAQPPAPGRRRMSPSCGPPLAVYCCRSGAAALLRGLRSQVCGPHSSLNDGPYLWQYRTVARQFRISPSPHTAVLQWHQTGSMLAAPIIRLTRPAPRGPAAAGRTAGGRYEYD